jgi:hypothetical protein
MARDLLPRADLGKRAVNGRVEIDAQGLLAGGKFLAGSSDMGRESVLVLSVLVLSERNGKAQRRGD